MTDDDPHQIKVAKDASFLDAADRPLRLQAFDTDDLTVISALLQDSVCLASDIRWMSGARRLVVLVNRFRWEGARQDRAAERVRTLLVIDEADAVRSQGVQKHDGVTVLSILSVAFEPGAEGRGRVILTLAGDGVIAIDVAALEVVLRDVTRPYAAPSGRAPTHPE